MKEEDEVFKQFVLKFPDFHDYHIDERTGIVVAQGVLAASIMNGFRIGFETAREY